LAAALSGSLASAQRGMKAPPGPSTEIKTPSGKLVKSGETLERMTPTWTLKSLDFPPTDKPKIVGDPLRTLIDQSYLPPDYRFPRPTIVWFTKQEPDPKAELQLFGTDEIGIAARWFDCFKIFVEDIGSKEDRLRYAKSTPTIYFFDSAARQTGRLTACSAGDVMREMVKAANVHFKRPLGTLTSKYAEFLERFDDVAGRQARLGNDQRDLDRADLERPSEKTKAQLKKVRDELADLERRRVKLDEEEKALLTVEFKFDPYAPLK
jgi:hypothetical protein